MKQSKHKQNTKFQEFESNGGCAQPDCGYIGHPGFEGIPLQEGCPGPDDSGAIGYNNDCPNHAFEPDKTAKCTCNQQKNIVDIKEAKVGVDNSNAPEGLSYTFVGHLEQDGILVWGNKPAIQNSSLTGSAGYGDTQLGPGIEGSQHPRVDKVDEFNEKYKQWLEPGHYGLAIEDEALILFLDNIFKDLTKIPGFQYSQIKWKFGSSRFYSNLGGSLSSLIEQEINEILK